MTLILQRIEYLSTGIFGTLELDDGTILQSLEHAYSNQVDGTVGAVTWVPKIPAGTYTCMLGQHILNGMINPFWTYEVMNVPDHTGCLIHPGNSEADSEGCILLGSTRLGDDIMASRNAFHEFMNSLNGLDSFTLVIQ